MILILLYCTVLTYIKTLIFLIYLLSKHRYLVSQGCIKPLCDLLVCPDARIVIVCLEGLENILKAGETDKSTTDVNLFAQLIDDAEGLEKIENLQSHENAEIYEKVPCLLFHMLVL